MSYLGDIRLGETLDCKFSTRSFTTGAPTTLSGSPVISAYPGNSTTELTAGITLTVDFDSRTGLNNVRIVATSGNGYATATNYELVITTGTVGGVSVVGEVVGSFSIENRSALMPTTAARTLDVTAANKVNGVVLVDTLTTYTGNTAQTGDAFARLGAPAGASVSADIATRATPAQVNTEVLDVLNTDTFAEPGQEAPPATTTLVKKLGWLYKLARNKLTQSSSEFKVFADDGATVDNKATVSDDGSVFTRNEIGSGP
jgi:hypothetical protein